MNRAELSALWDHFRTVNGITLRVIDAIPGDKIDTRPCRDMRTPRELVGHMYCAMRAVAEGTAKGEIHWSEADDAKAIEPLKTLDDLKRFARDAWEATDRAIRSLSDAQIAGMVQTPWNEAFPGFVCVHIIYDEHLHHRGQLYAYLRQMGATPPFVWDFQNNAPEFQPRQAQQA